MRSTALRSAPAHAPASRSGEPRRAPAAPVLGGGPWTWIGWAGVAVIAVVGWVLRVQLATHQPIDGDEAVTGLLANQVLHGHLFTFYWGNQYGGGEFYVVAGLFAVFGHTATVLKLTSSLMAFLAALAIYGAARAVCRESSRWFCAVVAGVSWLWPEVAVWNSTREYGFRGLTMLCGILLVGLTGRFLASASWPIAALLGLVLGVGIWSSPEIIYFCPAVAVALVASWIHRAQPHTLRMLAAGVVGVLVGAAPWLWTNAHTNFASLSASSSPSYAASTYTGRVHLCLTESLPLMLGLRHPVTGAWVGGGLGQALAVLIAVLVALACVLAFGRIAQAGQELLAGVCASLVLFPFLAAAFPATSFWIDGHYAVFVLPLGILAAAGTLSTLPGARLRLPWPAFPLLTLVAAGLVVVVAFVDTGVLYKDQFLGSYSQFWRQKGAPNAVAARTAEDLLALHVRYGYADYWTAYKVDFLSGDRLQLADPSADRWVAQYRAVTRSPDPVWVFFDPDQVAAATAAFGASTQGPFADSLAIFEAQLIRLKVGYQVEDAGVLRVVVTDRRVTQGEVGMGGPAFGG